MASIAESLNLALQHHQAGRLQEAETLCMKILSIDPSCVDAVHLLGVIAHQVGQDDIAIEYINKAIMQNPIVADFHNSLGEAYRAQGRLEEAMACYRLALTLRPAYAAAHNNLGNVLKEQGKLEEAMSHYRQALALEPTLAEAHANMGNVFQGYDKLEETLVCYRQALALKPTLAEAHNSLGYVFQEQGKLEEALSCYRQALAFKPGYAEAYNNLGNVLKDQGNVEEAMTCYQHALALKPDYHHAHSNLVFGMSYCSIYTPEDIAAEHRKWNDHHVGRSDVRTKTHKNRPDPERRLRVGYVSADFSGHPIGYWVEPILAAHRRNNIEIFCYTAGRRSDETTRRLKASARAWRDIASMQDAAAAELIEADRIDILVDLSGHTRGNRLLVFARKPAPVQATYLGSLTTTGLATIDYKLTDRFLSPADSKEQFTEELIRLPGCFACYQAPAEAPNVSALPSLQNGHVTFGSFNNMAKVTPLVVALWSRILREVPRSRMILKDKSLIDQGQRDRYHKLFEENGIAAPRLELLPGTPFPNHLGEYQNVDIALDPFPYNGCYTSSEALWMGVPIVTLAGSMTFGRYGVTLLSNLGRDALVAITPDEYVEKAVNLANNQERLASLRGELRQLMISSPLCDSIGLARALENAYRFMWRRWCQSQP